MNVVGLPFLLFAIYLMGKMSYVVNIMNILFVLIFTVPPLVFHFYKKQIENYAFFTQLAVVIITSIKVYLMGGMLNTLTPLFVGFIAPVFALTFPNKKRAVFIFILFATSMISATLLNPYDSLDFLVSHYFLGFIIGVTFVFFSLYYFTTQLEKVKNDEKTRMEELDDIKTKFYTHITHEFRTPLSIITGMADQMKNNPSKWLNEGHSIIKRNSNNLINLTNQLLDLSKLEAHSMPLNLIQDNIALYIQYLMESFHSLAEVKNIRLLFSTEPKEIIMDFDPDKIRDIISNLISNAVKFTPKGGLVKTSLHIIDKNKLELIVKDTGIGIPKDQLHRVFDRYFQAKNQLEKLQEGSGLGLALTKELVKLLNGTVSIDSNLNKGSSFIIQIPITNQAKEIQLPLADEIPHTKISTATIDPECEGTQIIANHKLKILIVEDNADVIHYLHSLLSHTYNIEAAHNGYEGFEKALNIIPDLVISDVMMPVMDGFSLCKQLKQDIRTSHIPIVLLTARSDMDSRMEGLKTGADVYLSKPFNHDELFIRIEKLITLRKTLQFRYKALTHHNSSVVTIDNPQFSREDKFIRKVREVLVAHLSDEEFGIGELCRSLAMSRSQLYRKFAALTDTTVYHFIQTLKLKKAKELLLTTDLNVSEVAYDTGFKNLAHFSRVFTKEFGYTPSKVKI
ncbi:ATP-binding protein [Gaetbulibacter sp. M235]|uniref:hybrid sensor histidine kinase/response regulator transcription factor n=1 Tax=Gaetbulibacter sp. M235 TaxID=3126510 RepID=UPI00374E8FE3